MCCNMYMIPSSAFSILSSRAASAFAPLGFGVEGSTNLIVANCPSSSGRSNTLREEVAMTVRKRRSDRSGRSALPSPGRPSVARREDHRQFWAAIAAGRSSEDAAVGSEQRPEQHGGCFRRGQDGLGLDPPLELLVQAL